MKNLIFAVLLLTACDYDALVSDEIDSLSTVGLAISSEYGNRELTIIKSYDVDLDNGAYTFYDYDGAQIDLAGKELIIYTTKVIYEIDARYIVTLTNESGQIVDTVAASKISRAGDTLKMYTRNTIVLWTGNYSYTEIK